MNIGGIVFPAFNPYDKAAVEIYLSGCNKNCKGCHNPELKSYNYGEKLDSEKLINYLKEREDLFSIISITGGEFFDQEEKEMFDFVAWLKTFFKNKQFWLFTGREKKEIDYKENRWVFISFDVIKTGPYIEELKQEGFPASSNQKLLIKGKDY